MFEYLTVPEVAKVLRVDDTTVRRWIEKGILEAIRLPAAGPRTTYRIPKKTLEQLLGEPL
ncbi:helix-turn-helix domain-containing protein [Dictyobacter formicarum]|uniref:Helix-turn-helix domain-containing protein n=1 Tax=Dictyobacter formicarum TaxID=2778368 RepID=A0ABQ3VPL6_9CHLR|nr:helix-turn-helix domain-containing protein [Dictyobacter formicarum]GHO88199.1 hypothetical protein KSZ_62050 [Dictyobacter formicarum]